ncbi:MAG: hypothetical protein WBU92_10115 [Candidatus Dormiibacterota bacterium]
MNIPNEAPSWERVAELTAREEQDFRRRQRRSQQLVEWARRHSPGGVP